MEIFATTTDGTFYLFEGGYGINIVKGGEALPNNSYGFEVEFCSHDSSVFAFTHVDALTIDFDANDIDASLKAQLTGWRVESDSGGVLELVTRPLFFAHVKDAHLFRERLVRILTASVTPANPVQTPYGTIKAVLLGPWLEQVRQPIAALCGEALRIAAPVASVVTLSTWEQIGAQLNEENIDDGVNIPAARMRHAMNKDSWTNYVDHTVLSRSEKDWRSGYSSQLNMPMSLAGYFLYSRQKYERARDRMAQIKRWIEADRRIPGDMTNSALRKNIETWFWRSVIWDAFDHYVRLLAPGYGSDVWTPTNIASWTLPQMTVLSLIYVMTNKLLTGAMGSLSEPGQLRIQQYAWIENSSAVMATDGPGQDLELLMRIGDVNRGWLDFHSSMKDLTGLWFKAALFDVIGRETIDPGMLKDLGMLLSRPNLDVWSPVFESHLHVVSSDAWNDPLQCARPDYVDDLEDLDVRSLVQAIGIVQRQLGDALGQPGTWNRYEMPADPAARKFLHYSDAPPWEGRYDTMYKPIARGSGFTYLIEHRFN